jgi:CheY-like chemotaxis protein
MIQTMTILIADDDEDDIELLEEAIREFDPNIKCSNAANGIEVLKQLDYGDALPDCIFLDLNMPKMDGKFCLKHLKSSPVFRQIPVIIYSTSRRTADVNEVTQMGAMAFIVKPNTFVDLKREIARILTMLRQKSSS